MNLADQVLGVGILGHERHLEYFVGNSVIRHIVHLLKHFFDAIADGLQRIFGLLAMLRLDRLEGNEKRDDTQNE
ncbi:hypothetical protein D3C77_696690 [compost metagenome]